MPSCDVVLEPAARSAPHDRLFGDGAIASCSAVAIREMNAAADELPFPLRGRGLGEGVRIDAWRLPRRGN